MNHFVAATVAQHNFDFTAFVAGDLACIGGAVGREPAADLVSGRVLERDGVAAFEPPFDGDNAMNILFRHLDGGATPLSVLRSDLTKSLCALVERVMAREVENRPADATAFARELEEVEL